MRISSSTICSGQSAPISTDGGPGLATHAINAGLVDEIQVFVAPVLVGGGKHHSPTEDSESSSSSSTSTPSVTAWFTSSTVRGITSLS
jgi:riboflavin biosynthesis pyrimidine reductase